MEEGPDGGERRARVRHRTLLAGKIIVADGYISADCTILDLSDSRARGRIPGSVILPPPLGLLIVRDGVFYDAAIAWRRADHTGLVFNARHDLRTDEDPGRRGARAIWRESAPR